MDNPIEQNAATPRLTTPCSGVGGAADSPSRAPESALLPGPPPNTVCLIFDWDGTLADSYTANYAAIADVLGRYGLIMSRSWFDAHTGLSTAEMVEAFLSAKGVTSPAPLADIVARNDAAFLRAIDLVRENRQVVDVLRRYRSTHRIAIGSGSSRASIQLTPLYGELHRFVDCLVTRDDVREGKPAPDIFLAICNQLGVSPGDCLVYEDSDQGLEAAEVAGIRAIDVRPYLRAELIDGPAEA